MKKIAIHVYILTTIIDFFSTLPVLVHEENPVARYFIERNGGLGLLVFDVVIVCVVVGIILLTAAHIKDTRLRNAVYVSVIILSAFRLLIALTNIGIAPYWMTAWFGY